MVVFLLIRGVATPPKVSIERVNGVTSRRRTSLAPSSPLILPPCTAAPRATHSSGFKFLEGSFPVSCFTFSCTTGILVEPPTKSTFPRSELLSPASFMEFCTGTAVLSVKSEVISSNFALLSFISKCFGPSAVAVMKGRLISVVVAEESSFFAFSAASFKRCKAILS